MTTEIWSILFLCMTAIPTFVGIIDDDKDGNATKKSARSQPLLTAEWHGVWKGTCRMEGGRGLPPFAMELHVAPAGEVNKWTIVYGEGEKAQHRRYELRPGDRPGHYVMDEKNGILIDCQLFDKTLVSQFTVSGVMVATRFELRSDSVEVEMISFEFAKPRTSKPPGGTVEVQSFPVRSRQIGSLKRAG